LLHHLKTLRTEPTFRGGIIWCYSEKTAVSHEQLTGLDNRNVQFHEGVPENFSNVNGEPFPIILDDRLNDVYSKELCVFFTRGSHHRNVSVILITQNLFHQGKHCRDISLNAKYLVLLKNVRDKNQFTHLARQVYPENSSSLYKAYLDATQRHHGYLLLDLSQDSDDRIRFRTNVFPSEYPPIIYAADVDDVEADKGKLSRS
jgi:hypothetical protein